MTNQPTVVLNNNVYNKAIFRVEIPITTINMYMYNYLNESLIYYKI